MGAIAFLYVVFSRTAMNEDSQIQLHTRPVFPPPGAAPQVPQMINVGGQLYQMTPVSQYQQPQRFNVWPYLALAGTFGCLTGAIALIISNGHQVIAPTQPVVIEKPVPIPTTVKPHCIMFCGEN